MGLITMINNLESQNKIILKAQISNLAIWSVVLGILSMPPFPFGFLTGIPAVLCGNKALNIIEKDAHRGKGLAWTGIIMGYLSILLTVILIILILTGILKP